MSSSRTTCGRRREPAHQHRVLRGRRRRADAAARAGERGGGANVVAATSATKATSLLPRLSDCVPPVLFRIRVELLAAVHVPSPTDPFLERFEVDPREFRSFKDEQFYWWNETGTEHAGAKILQSAAGRNKIAEATVCDPYVRVEVHGGHFCGADDYPAGGGDCTVRNGSVWESDPVRGNGLSAHWQGCRSTFEIVSSHPEITQALFTIGYRRGDQPADKIEPLALGAINLSCVRAGVRCFSLREPKHGMPLRFTKLLLRVTKDPIPVEKVAEAMRKERVIGKRVIGSVASSELRSSSGGTGGGGRVDDRSSANTQERSSSGPGRSVQGRRRFSMMPAGIFGQRGSMPSAPERKRHTTDMADEESRSVPPAPDGNRRTTDTTDEEPPAAAVD